MRERLVADHKKLLTKYKIDDSLMFDSITEKIRNVLKSDEFNNLDNVGVVLLESKSGKIRAMVQKDESEANINLGIGQLGFEPGSIFKILTEAIALNEGLINVHFIVVEVFVIIMVNHMLMEH